MKAYSFVLLGLLTLTTGSKPIKDSPSGLMVEFIREPSSLQIMDLRPEFSWIVPASAERQTAYRILVASTQGNIAEDKGDVWDSGKMMSDMSVEVGYKGEELRKNTTYFWKIMIWDSKGKPSEYSPVQAFKTGNAVNYLTTSNKFQSPIISPVKLSRVSEGHYFADFGKDAFGTIIITINSPADGTVTVHLGEKLSGTETIDRNPGGTIRYTKVALPVTRGTREYTVSLPADKRNTSGAAVILPDSTGVITPFRYCEVENCPSELKPSDMKQKVYHYYFEEDNSAFTSSDTALNKVWDICKYSIKATSFAGLYVDGDRERIPYEADAYINQLGHYYTDREFSIARRTNEYFISHPTWPTEWILHTVPMFYNDFMFTGNIESVRAFYDELREKTLYSIAGSDGLISSANVSEELMKKLGFGERKESLRDIVDWPPAQKDTGWKLVTPEGERDGYDMVATNTMVNAFYYRSLVCMSELASALGKKDDADFFRNLSEKAKASFNQKLLDKTKGIYVDGAGSDHSSLHANMTALAFGLVPGSNRKTVIEFIKSRGMACSVYGAQYLMEGLYRAGEADYALRLLTSTGDRSWWNMIRSGSTITLEAWDMKYKPNSDWNHAWGAVPANIIPGGLWGIEPVTPGYAKARIRPQLSMLRNCSITVPTIRGKIMAEYIDNGKTKEYTITIPGNMECDMLLGEVQDVYLNNKKIKAANGTIKLFAGRNNVRFIK
jgi:hypothetical protein